jgi:putative FmdB family regulatory protein
MPTYDFSCPNGHEFEQFYRSISSAPTEVACPVCGAIAIRRVSGGSGLLFKGSGFYITDYGKDGKKDQRAAQGKSETKSTDSGSSGSSSKSGE